MSFELDPRPSPWRGDAHCRSRSAPSTRFGTSPAVADGYTVTKPFEVPLVTVAFLITAVAPHGHARDGEGPQLVDRKIGVPPAGASALVRARRFVGSKTWPAVVAKSPLTSTSTSVAPTALAIAVGRRSRSWGSRGVASTN